MTVTFVSAFIDLDESRPVDKSLPRYFQLFHTLASTGIRFHLFMSHKYRGQLALPNGIIEYIDLDELDFYKIAPKGLPEHRNMLHDTRNFLILMNAKIELVKRAIQSQMHSSSHYAWIDFGICHMFRVPQITLPHIKDISTTEFPETCTFFPGCWEQPASIFTHVNWRFCGSFFLGDARSLMNFYEMYAREYPTLPNLVWEVNVWSHLETLGWKPNWYKADHDDSILNIPHVSTSVRVPSKVHLYWAGGYSSCYPGSAIEQFVFECIRRHPKKASAIFTQSDGLIGQEEYDRITRLSSKNDQANTPAGKEYDNLVSKRCESTEAILCMLCTRKFSRDNILLLPLDDDTFNRGLTEVLSTFQLVPWETKIAKAYWRGGSSGCDRPTIRHKVAESLYGASYSDVRFTPGGWQENDALIPSHLFVSNRTDLAEHFKYKYILILDGNCIASAHQWVFGSGSVPVMVTHPDNEYWFKKFLKPMIHYVPIQYDLSDLHEKLTWLVTHDAEAKQIADNAMAFSKSYFSSEFQKAYVYNEISRILSQPRSMLDTTLEIKSKIPSDINEHLYILQNYAKSCSKIVECGVLNPCSSYAFANAIKDKPDNSLILIDPFVSREMDGFLEICKNEGVNAQFLNKSDLDITPSECDLLFVDSWHVYAQLKRELALWHRHVKKYILLHDTTVDEWYGESVRGNANAEEQSRATGFPVREIQKGLWPAVTEFLREHPEWNIVERFTNNNGLTVLMRE